MKNRSHHFHNLALMNLVLPHWRMLPRIHRASCVLDVGAAMSLDTLCAHVVEHGIRAWTQCSLLA